MSVAQMVREFHERFDIPIQGAPTATPRTAALRIALLTEEFAEYVQAALRSDLIEVADALADMVYVIYGTALVYGIPLDAVLAEVHRSNMSKLGEDDRPVLREDGKVVKGPRFFRPDIASVLTREEPTDG